MAHHELESVRIRLRCSSSRKASLGTVYYIKTLCTAVPRMYDGKGLRSIESAMWLSAEAWARINNQIIGEELDDFNDAPTKI